METDKVSVIIPTYNRAKFISNAIKSIIYQNHNNTEIIIVDDGSSDNTQDVVNSIKKNYSNIIYCNNERSKGPSGARNTGILKASGDYLSFLDSDDVWIDNHLITGLRILNENPEIDVLFGNFRIVELSTGKHLFNFFDHQKILQKLKYEQVTDGIKILQDNLFKALIQSNFFHFGSSIIRTSSTNGILMDESIMFAEDRDFAIKLFKQASATFAMRKDPVFILYKHDSNICNAVSGNNRQEILKAHIYLYTKYLRIFNLSNDERRITNKAIARNLSDLAYSYWINKEYNNFSLYMLRSFKYYLTISQLRTLIKVLIFPMIRDRYNSENSIS